MVKLQDIYSTDRVPMWMVAAESLWEQSVWSVCYSNHFSCWMRTAEGYDGVLNKPVVIFYKETDLQNFSNSELTRTSPSHTHTYTPPPWMTLQNEVLSQSHSKGIAGRKLCICLSFRDFLTSQHRNLLLWLTWGSSCYVAMEWLCSNAVLENEVILDTPSQ